MRTVLRIVLHIYHYYAVVGGHDVGEVDFDACVVEIKVLIFIAQ